jgi:peptidoglycan/xylan/chitin deacetylase (PgdA/CDA1 family)
VSTLLKRLTRNKRRRAASLLDRSGVVRLFLAARRQLPNDAWVTLNYHRINHPASLRDFDENVLNATPDGFDQQVEFLCRNFSIVDPDDLGKIIRDRAWPRNAALITFDDGYLDNYEYALPVLQRHGAKALFFVTTDNIERRKLFWWDRINYTLKHAKKSIVTLSYPHAVRLDLTSGYQAAVAQLLTIVKTTYALDIERFLSELVEAAGVDWSDAIERQMADQHLMTWEQVRAMRKAGMTIGSHTRHHRVLGTVPTAEFSDELLGSRQDIEAQLGEPIRTISYPVGGSVVHSQAIRAALESAGYEVGFAYGSAQRSWRIQDADPFDIPRLVVNPNWSLAEFRAMTTLPMLR